MSCSGISVSASERCRGQSPLGRKPDPFDHGLRGSVGLAKVMDVRPEYSGSASALMVCLSASIGSIGTPALAPFLPSSAVALGIPIGWPGALGI